MTGFNISLPESVIEYRLAHVSVRDPRADEEEMDILLVRLPGIPITLLGLLFQDLQPSLQGFILCTMVTCVPEFCLVLLDLLFQLLDVLLEDGILVCEGTDLLLFGCVLLLQSLDLCFQLFALIVGGICLETEGL